MEDYEKMKQAFDESKNVIRVEDISELDTMWWVPYLAGIGSGIVAGVVSGNFFIGLIVAIVVFFILCFLMDSEEDKIKKLRKRAEDADDGAMFAYGMQLLRKGLQGEGCAREAYYTLRDAANGGDSGAKNVLGGRNALSFLIDYGFFKDALYELKQAEKSNESEHDYGRLYFIIGQHYMGEDIKAWHTAVECLDKSMSYGFYDAKNHIKICKEKMKEEKERIKQQAIRDREDEEERRRIEESMPRCAYHRCRKKITPEHMRYGAIVDTVNGPRYYCCRACKIDDGYGGR